MTTTAPGILSFAISRSMIRGSRVRAVGFNSGCDVGGRGSAASDCARIAKAVSRLRRNLRARRMVCVFLVLFCCSGRFRTQGLLFLQGISGQRYVGLGGVYIARIPHHPAAGAEFVRCADLLL